MKTVCCKCNRTKKGTRWIKTDTTGEKLSHGYCPACLKELLKSSREYFLALAGRLAA